LKIFFGFFNPFFLCVLDKGYNSEQQAIEAAINLLKMKKLSPEEIAQVQGLPLKKVLKLKKSITE
jgi:hypothetical protein